MPCRQSRGGPRTAPLTALRRPRARPRALCPLPAECTRAPGPLTPRVLLAARRASPESSFPALLLRVCEDQGGAGRPPQRCRPRLAAPPRRGPVVPRQDSAAKAWPHWAVFGACPWTAGTPTFCLGVAAEEHTEPGARRGPAQCGGRRSAAPGLLAGRSSPAPAGPAADGPAAQRPAGASLSQGPGQRPGCRLRSPAGCSSVTYDIGTWSRPSLRTAWRAGTALEGVLPVCRARGHASSYRGQFGGDGGLARTPLALRVSERQSQRSRERADPLRGGRGCSRRSGQTRPGEREVSPQPASAPPPPALRGHWIVLAKRRGSGQEAARQARSGNTNGYC